MPSPEGQVPEVQVPGRTGAVGESATNCRDPGLSSPSSAARGIPPALLRL